MLFIIKQMNNYGLNCSFKILKYDLLFVLLISASVCVCVCVCVSYDIILPSAGKLWCKPLHPSDLPVQSSITSTGLLGFMHG